MPRLEENSPVRLRYILPNRCRIYAGDAIPLMHYLANRGRKANLIFADPPFNIDYSYDVYKDNLERKDYVNWTRRWLLAAHALLDDHGSIYVAIGTGMQADVRKVMDECGFVWRSTLCWHYTFGPRQAKNWTPSWVAIHYAVKDRDFYTWNPEAVSVPSLRQLKYGDKRAKAGGKVPDNVWVLNPMDQRHSAVPTGPDIFSSGSDALLESRVCGTFKERTPHPCQMPMAVLERIIKASSREGDVVFDPFLGSGTTAEVALNLGRQAWGCELSEDYLNDIIIPRLRGSHAGT